MTQVTVRGISKDLERKIRALARREQLSLNQAVLRILQKGAGLDQSPENADTVGTALDSFFGTWTKEQADEMRHFEEDFEKIDEGMWK